MLTRSRKAFTLIELIVVLVILAILAAIAVPTYQAVITKAKESSAQSDAQAFAHEVDSLAAFDNKAPNTTNGATPNLYTYVNAAQSDINGTSTAPPAVGSTANQVTWSDANGCSSVITLGTASGLPSLAAAGTCP